MTSVVDAAKELARAGFSIFPCDPDKRPHVKKWADAATTDETVIRQWWRDWPDAMIGLPTGSVSGLYVIDLDIDKDTGEVIGEQTVTRLGLKAALHGRKFYEVLDYWGFPPADGTFLFALTRAVSTQTLILFVLAIIAGIVLAKTTFGYMVSATGGNRRAAEYAGINTDRVRFLSLVFVAMCASLAGLINIAWFRSFGPAAGTFRELDVIASVIIGGGSIFGGFGTVLGALAGAAVITLLRALLSLQVLTDNGSFVMPQHWVNVAVGLVLIIAVLSDIWFRQEGIHQRIRQRIFRPGAQRPAGDQE